MDFPVAKGKLFELQPEKLDAEPIDKDTGSVL